jgi:hypothetical protein
MRRLLLFCVLALGCDKKADPTPIPVTPTLDNAPGAGGPLASASVEAPKKRPKERFDAVEVNVPVGKSSLHVAWQIPNGTGINDEAPFAVRWVSSDGLAVTPIDIHAFGRDVEKGFEIPIELMTGTSGGKLAGDLDMVVCDTATHAVCVPLRRQLEITLNPSKGSALGSLNLPLPAAR